MNHDSLINNYNMKGSFKTMKNERYNQLRTLKAQMYFIMVVMVLSNLFLLGYFNSKINDLREPSRETGALVELSPVQSNYSEIAKYYIPTRTSGFVTTDVAIINPQEINSAFDILTPCGYSKDELAYMLSSDSYKNLSPYIDTFILAEERYGVNAFYLICKCGLESGWGTYPSGENNIAGWRNDDGSYRDFSSVDDCILHVAENLSSVYKDKVGSELKAVCVRYSTSSDYSDRLLSIMAQRKNKIEEMETY